MPARDEPETSAASPPRPLGASGEGVALWRALMSPFPGSQKRGAEGGGALRLSDLVMSGVTALLPEREVGRGEKRGICF